MMNFREFVGNAMVKLGVIRLLIWFAEKWEGRRDSANVWQFPFIQSRKERVFQILMYHRVNDSSDGFLPATSVDVFSMQMEILAQYCFPCTLEEMVDRIKMDDIPDRAVVVTLDDGYRDNFTHAFPILQGCAIPATIFLATEVIGTSGMLWHDKVCWAISQTSVSDLHGFGSPTTYSLNSSAQKVAAMEKVLWYFRSLSNFERIEQIHDLVRVLEVHEDESGASLMLDWDEVRSMYAAGIRFGAHTVSHPILSSLSENEVRDEVRRSKRTIEDVLQGPVTSFAYPSGRTMDFNEKVKAVVQEEGYSCAVTTVQGVNSNRDDIFSLKRTGFWDSNPGNFGIRLGLYKFCS